jgi:hypothetical protein
MNVEIHANICDYKTEKIMNQLTGPFEFLGNKLSHNYGGTMEHLWIDFELSSMSTKHSRPFSFRFQKRVSGKSQMIAIDSPDLYNVGHYSVRPNFKELHKAKDAVQYALQIIYESTEVLIEKQKRLKGFDALLFRSEFVIQCENIGYDIRTTIPKRSYPFFFKYIDKLRKSIF